MMTKFFVILNSFMTLLMVPSSGYGMEDRAFYEFDKELLGQAKAKYDSMMKEPYNLDKWNIVYPHEITQDSYYRWSLSSSRAPGNRDFILFLDAQKGQEEAMYKYIVGKLNENQTLKENITCVDVDQYAVWPGHADGGEGVVRPMLRVRINGGGGLSNIADVCNTLSACMKQDATDGAIHVEGSTSFTPFSYDQYKEKYNGTSGPGGFTISNFFVCVLKSFLIEGVPHFYAGDYAQVNKNQYPWMDEDGVCRHSYDLLLGSREENSRLLVGNIIPEAYYQSNPKTVGLLIDSARPDGVVKAGQMSSTHVLQEGRGAYISHMIATYGLFFRGEDYEEYYKNIMRVLKSSLVMRNLIHDMQIFDRSQKRGTSPEQIRPYVRIYPTEGKLEAQTLLNILFKIREATRSVNEDRIQKDQSGYHYIDWSGEFGANQGESFERMNDTTRCYFDESGTYYKEGLSCWKQDTSPYRLTNPADALAWGGEQDELFVKAMKELPQDIRHAIEGQQHTEIARLFPVALCTALERTSVIFIDPFSNLKPSQL